MIFFILLVRNAEFALLIYIFIIVERAFLVQERNPKYISIS